MMLASHSQDWVPDYTACGLAGSWVAQESEPELDNSHPAAAANRKQSVLGKIVLP